MSDVENCGNCYYWVDRDCESPTDCTELNRAWEPKYKCDKPYIMCGQAIGNNGCYGQKGCILRSLRLPTETENNMKSLRIKIDNLKAIFK